MNFSKGKANNFDNLLVNVPKLYRKFSLEDLGSQFAYLPKAHTSPFQRLYALSFIPLTLRNYLWYLFHRTNLDITWLEEFKPYWRGVLGGLTLWGPQDFYFIRNWYRLKFQHSKVSQSGKSDSHLKAWQRPEILYQLLDMVYRQSLFNDIRSLLLYKRFAPRSNASVLEFGCGTAPVTEAFLTFGESRPKNIYISDIQTIFFHYAAFRFRHRKKVKPILLQKDKDFMPVSSEKLGAIFCLTVYEHLQKPLEVTKKFNSLLVPGGILVFDYLISDGKGMDTKAALKQRGKVLNYIKNNFEIVAGRLETKGEAKVVVARKK